jgi:hypothetical protein
MLESIGLTKTTKCTALGKWWLLLSELPITFSAAEIRNGKIRIY